MSIEYLVTFHHHKRRCEVFFVVIKKLFFRLKHTHEDFTVFYS